MSNMDFTDRFDDSLLVTRAKAAKMLGGVSVSTIIRRERDGLLTAIRLNGRSGKVLYSVGQIVQLAAGRN